MSEVPVEGRLVAGRYRLLGALGEGRTGVVWQARDEALGREVAVKEITVTEAGSPAGAAAAGLRQQYAELERAARTAGRISHRSVAAVHDVVTEDGRPWIVMELVRGLALSDVLAAEGPLAPQRAAHIGAEVLAALRAGHVAGVVHGDVKPEHVLIANDGRIVLTDFGVAMPGAARAFPAPEVALGGDAVPESDLWSLGALLYAAVEGRSPAAGPEVRPSARAGTLTPVLAALLRQDPAERIRPGEAEHQLRLASAGGAPGAAAEAPGSLSRTPLADDGEASSPAPSASRRQEGEATVTGAGPQARPSAPSRRPAAVLATGVVLLLTAVAALLWALTQAPS
ncbi:serine/threonine-protein kinase [Streptomyces sp. NPDC002889]|uniref:serine/threonine-protein kinase n=1 Tax=Streptomyces sp. NPDC002889 TaxID=3364669 RepID=UPI0036CB7522